MSLLISFVFADSSCEPCKKSENYTKWNILGRSRWIPFGRFREEVENVSANHRPWRPSCFSDRPEKHKLSKGRIKSCFLSSFVEFHSLIDVNIFYFNFSMKRDSLVSEKSKMSIVFWNQDGCNRPPLSNVINTIRLEKTQTWYVGHW